MRSGLLALGIILLVLGGVFYFYPHPTASAVAQVESPQGTIPANLEAGFTVPYQFVLASLILGAIFTLLGLLVPDSVPRVYVDSKREEHYEDVDERNHRHKHKH